MKIKMVVLILAMAASAWAQPALRLSAGTTNHGQTMALTYEFTNGITPEAELRYTFGQMIAAFGFGGPIFDRLYIRVAAGAGIHERPGWTPIITVPIAIEYYFVKDWFVSLGLAPVFHTRNSAHEFEQTLCLGYRHEL